MSVSLATRGVLGRGAAAATRGVLSRGELVAAYVVPIGRVGGCPSAVGVRTSAVLGSHAERVEGARTAGERTGGVNARVGRRGTRARVGWGVE